MDPIFSIKKLGNVFELSEITENKKEKAELEKEMERTMSRSLGWRMPVIKGHLHLLT